MLKRRARPNSSVASTYRSSSRVMGYITEVNLILQIIGSLIPSWFQGFAVSAPLHTIRRQNAQTYGSIEANEPDSGIRSHHSLIKRGIIQLDDLQLSSRKDNVRYPIHTQSSRRAKQQGKTYSGVRAAHFLNATHLAFIIKQKSIFLPMYDETNSVVRQEYYLHLNDQYISMNARQYIHKDNIS